MRGTNGRLRTLEVPRKLDLRAGVLRKDMEAWKGSSAIALLSQPSWDWKEIRSLLQ